jgi:hypothetical protein
MGWIALRDKAHISALNFVLQEAIQKCNKIMVQFKFLELKKAMHNMLWYKNKVLLPFNLWDVGICCDTHVLFRSRPAKLFRAVGVCWIPDGAPCVAVSWLAGGRLWWTWKGSSCVAVSGLAGGRVWWPWKGSSCVAVGWLAGGRALKRIGVFLLSFTRAAGWRPGGGDL